MLNLYKLEIFQVVAEAGSFSAAAKRLLMSQPGVSQHIHDLESSLGVTLFIRGRGGVTLTPEGETLHTYSERIFKLVTEAENAVTDIANLPSGGLGVGATPGVSVYLLPNWISSFRGRYPRMTVTLQTGTTPQIVADIQRGSIEMGFIEGELDPDDNVHLDIRELGAMDQLVIVSMKHPWGGRASITIDELHDQTFIMRQPNSQTRIWLNEILAAHNITPRVNAEFDNVESIKRAVMMGECLAILPEYTIRDEIQTGLLHALPVENNPLQRVLKLITPSDRPLGPVATAFKSHVIAEFERSL